MRKSLSIPALTLALLAAAGCAAATFAAEAPLLITMELEPASTLPGIPVSMRFTVFNQSDQPMEFPGLFALEVQPPEGEPYLEPWGIYEPQYIANVLPAVYEGRLTVEPGATRSFLGPVNTMMTSPLVFGKAEMFAPGRYRLRAGFHESLYSETAQAALRSSRTIAEVAEGVSGLLVTNEVDIEIEKPQGDDLAVWNLILERSAGAGWIRIDYLKRYSLAKEICDRFPSSRYTPYMIAARPLKPGETGKDKKREIARIDRNHPSLDWFDLFHARFLAQEVGRALSDRDLSRALRLAQAARDELQDLIKRTKNDVVSLEAAAATVRSDNDIYLRDRIIAATQPPPPSDAQRIRAFVTCAKETGQNVTVTFGYENPNNYPVTLPIGEKNRFDPAPGDRRQPTTFLPGRHEEAITIEIEGKKKDGPRMISWVVDRSAATGPADKGPKCKK